ncbi:MAG: sugar transferase [Cellulomonas sp.]|uniref:sugar transferase n=1 Tax=Cellulomonas sp. TaxID=40001 RepID=UPI0017AD26DF|nr:sugar transferase [Cellulomonas sp.]NMM30639.1 sugar transferase [Cellulomonas sp.]
MYEYLGKRVFDITFASAGLLVLSPLLALTGICIWLEDRQFFLFLQVRVGRDGVPFTLWKFRSMPVGTPNVPSAHMAALTTTRIGSLIRRVSFDEMPQLANVIRGDMSLVGPRPALPAQVELLLLRKETGASRLRPGLTGLAQVRSYTGMSDEAKAAHDGEYSMSVSLVNDLRILVKTAAYLLTPPPKY